MQVASSGNIFAVGFKTGILKIIAVPFKEIIGEKLISLIEIQVKNNFFNKLLLYICKHC